LLACLVSMGVTALMHILVTVQRSWQRRWRVIESVQEIVCAGRYRLGKHQVEIDRLRGGFSLLLTSDDRQAEYRFANLPTLRLYLGAALPESESQRIALEELEREDRARGTAGTRAREPVTAESVLFFLSR